MSLTYEETFAWRFKKSDKEIVDELIAGIIPDLNKIESELLILEKAITPLMDEYTHKTNFTHKEGEPFKSVDQFIDCVDDGPNEYDFSVSSVVLKQLCSDWYRFMLEYIKLEERINYLYRLRDELRK